MGISFFGQAQLKEEKLILNRKREPEIKRIDKTVSEIEKEIGKNGYAVYINKSKFYQQTDFLICLGTVLTGIIILTLLYLFFRKKLIKPYDESEEQFYLAD